MLGLTLGQRLKRLRSQIGVSQERLAEVIGISRSALSMYELDQREPDVLTILKFADFFSVTTDYLLGRQKAIDMQQFETKENLRRLIKLVIREVQEEYAKENDKNIRYPPKSP